uniref:fimbrial protein n=1 Tax=Aquitalea pelogenes TaxID=1293573 RepID=UPI00128EDA16
MLRYLFALLCLFQIESAHAACSTITTGIRPINPILTVPGPDAPLVTPLSPWYLVANSRIFANCTANQPLVIGVASSNRTAGYFTDPIDGNNYTIFKFEMSNTVGYIVAAGPPGGSNMQPALPQNSGIGPFNTFTVTPSTSDLYASYKYRLIRYATLTDTNSFNMGGFASLILYWKTPDAPKFDPYVYTSFVQDGTVSFTNSIFKTCSILSTSLQVALPKIDANQLNSINSTAGSTAFSLPLNCPSPVNLYMTITDISAPGQTSNIVSL